MTTSLIVPKKWHETIMATACWYIVSDYVGKAEWTWWWRHTYQNINHDENMALSLLPKFKLQTYKYKHIILCAAREGNLEIMKRLCEQERVSVPFGACALAMQYNQFDCFAYMLGRLMRQNGIHRMNSLAEFANYPPGEGEHNQNGVYRMDSLKEFENYSRTGVQIDLKFVRALSHYMVCMFGFNNTHNQTRFVSRMRLYRLDVLIFYRLLVQTRDELLLCDIFAPGLLHIDSTEFVFIFEEAIRQRWSEFVEKNYAFVANWGVSPNSHFSKFYFLAVEYEQSKYFTIPHEVQTEEWFVLQLLVSLIAGNHYIEDNLLDSVNTNLSISNNERSALFIRAIESNNLPNVLQVGKILQSCESWEWINFIFESSFHNNLHIFKYVVKLMTQQPINFRQLEFFGFYDRLALLINFDMYMTVYYMFSRQRPAQFIIAALDDLCVTLNVTFDINAGRYDYVVGHDKVANDNKYRLNIVLNMCKCLRRMPIKCFKRLRSTKTTCLNLLNVIKLFLHDRRLKRYKVVHIAVLDAIFYNFVDLCIVFCKRIENNYTKRIKAYKFAFTLKEYVPDTADAYDSDYFFS